MTALIPSITTRFLQICDETVAAGVCRSAAEFAERLGMPRQNLFGIRAGTRPSTLDQVAQACKESGYDANWLLLGAGKKR